MASFASRVWLTLVLLGFVAATFVAYVAAEKRIDAANEQRQTSFYLIDELRHTSDDLTRMVRTYAATGIPLYKQHFQEILDIRGGHKPRPINYWAIYWDLVGPDNVRPRQSVEAVPLLSLIRQAGFSEAEIAKLAEAKAHSDELAKVEQAAMELLEGTHLAVASNRERAIEMLHDARYHAAKMQIMRPIDDVHAMVEQRTRAAVDNAEEQAFRLRIVFLVCVGILAWQLIAVRRREVSILGGTVEEVHAAIASLGGQEAPRSGVTLQRPHDSVLRAVERARWQLDVLNTERHRAATALRDSHERLREAQRIAAIGSWTLDLRNNQLEWSDEVFRIFEIDPERFGATYDAFVQAIHPEDREAVSRAYTESLDNRIPYEIEHRLLLDRGRVKWVLERCETLFAEEDGSPLLSRGTVQDITERKRSEETMFLYANVFEHSGEAIMITNADNNIVSVNAAFTRLTGYTTEEVLGKNPRILASQRTPPETYRLMWGAIQNEGYWQGELWDRAKDGHVYPKWVSISVIRTPSGRVANYVASFMDMSERKAAEEHINRLAHFDPLTGLVNRFSLQERLGQALLTAQREGNEVAVMLLDLDRFKTVNDTLGHHVGDALLVEVGQRILATVRESDIVARIGGDEFVVVLTGVESGMAAGAAIASKLLHRIGEVILYGDAHLHTTPSIGLSIFPADGAEGELLLKHADLAMYSAKAQGKNTFQFFSPAMNEGAIERMRIEQDLRLATERGDFELHYQPQICAADGRICGLEALIRWRHPQRGMIPPVKFIPVAEEAGLIEKLGAWVLNEACRQLAAWKAAGVPARRVAVNLSAHQLRSPDLVDLVRTTLGRHGIGAGELEIEVTESVAMEDPQRAVAQLTALRDLGVELAIDDFGTGYSSLAYLKLLPIQTLKLDRTFVKDIETDANDATISVATMALAHSLDLKVVAEGVETEAQRLFLAGHRCDIFQGYLFSKPLPADEAATFLANF